MGVVVGYSVGGELTCSKTFGTCDAEGDSQSEPVSSCKSEALRS